MGARTFCWKGYEMTHIPSNQRIICPRLILTVFEPGKSIVMGRNYFFQGQYLHCGSISIATPLSQANANLIIIFKSRIVFGLIVCRFWIRQASRWHFIWFGRLNRELFALLTFLATGSFERIADASCAAWAMVGSVLLCSVSVEGGITTEGSKPGSTGVLL